MKKKTPTNTYIPGTPTQEKTVVGRMSRFLDHPLAADCLACALLAVAVLLPLTALWELPGGTGALWGVVALVLVAFAVLRLRWWLTPLLLFVFVGANAVLHYYWRDVPQWIAYWSSFVLWIGQGMPYHELYTETGGLLLVQGLLAAAVTAVLFPLVRRPVLFPAALLLSGGGLVFLFILKPADFTLPLVFWTAGLILLLPGLHAHFVLKTPARARLQMLAIPGALLAVIAGLWITPEDTGAWQAQWLRHFVADLTAWVEGPFRNPSPLYSGFVTGEMGLQPLTERMGGPAVLNNHQILDVHTDTPVLLRGQVLDVYTGNNWATGWYDGDLRYNSLFWRSHRRTAFNLDLPAGRGMARKMYQDLTREINLDVMFLDNRFPSLFMAGRLRQMKFSHYVTDIEPYFNLRGELYTHAFFPRNSGFIATTRIWDKTLPDFDSKFLALEKETADRTDKWLEEYGARYTALPPTLPDSVRTLAAEITADAETPYQKALALSDWLAENTVYSLEPALPPADVDFVAHFLETRTGYCTYYATALAVMARAVDLPTRYVTGFALTRRTGSQDGRYLATGETAHAWVEIYFHGIGWLEFDPLAWDAQNPLNQRAAAQPTGPVHAVEEELPALEEPSFVLEEAELPEPAGLETESRSLLWVLVPVSLLALLVLFVFAYSFLRLYLRRRYHFYELDYVLRRLPDNAACMEYYYRDILRQLALLEVAPQPGETLVTFPRRVDRRLPLPDAAFVPVANAMMQVHFAQEEPGAEALQNAYLYHLRLEELLPEKLGRFFYVLRRVLARDKR